MINVARIGDRCRGFCSVPGHGAQSGVIISGTNRIIVDDVGFARVGDICKADCGDTGVIISGSQTTFIEGVNIARVGDRHVGTFTGVIISGSDRFFTE